MAHGLERSGGNRIPYTEVTASAGGVDRARYIAIAQKMVNESLEKIARQETDAKGLPRTGFLGIQLP